MQRVNELSGNIVAPYSVFYGTVRWQEELLTEIQPLGDCCPDADWILAGFIETHFHGMREYSAEVPEDLKKIPAIAPQNGVTMICPSFSCAPESALICLLETVRDLMRGIRTGAKVAGSHLEGPFLNPAQVGGMAPSQLRLPDMDEMKRYLDAADGTLKIVTIAPELPRALDVVRFLNTKKVAVMSGHSACPPELYEEAVAAGISRFCHLFDAYDDPVTTDGIRRPAE